MKHTKRLLALLTIFTLLFSSVAYAHSGRTDSAGGHRDNRNVSGLGYYHYHCGGNPPHLHTGGVCPYNRSVSYSKPQTAKPQATTAKPQTTAAKPATPTAKEVSTEVVVNGSAITGPVLWYKNNYFVPVNQLAGKLSAVVGPVNNKLELPVTQQKQQPVVQTVPDSKSSYMDAYVIFIPYNVSDSHYHKMDCYAVKQNGLSGYLAMDEGFLEIGDWDFLSPCPICMN